MELIILCVFAPKPSATIGWRVAEVAGEGETPRKVEEVPNAYLGVLVGDGNKRRSKLWGRLIPVKLGSN